MGPPPRLRSPCPARPSPKPGPASPSRSSAAIRRAASPTSLRGPMARPSRRRPASRCMSRTRRAPVGAIAAEQVKNAPADGHTLMWTISTTMIMNKVLFKKLPYDPDKDFVPISWMDAGHLPTIVSKNVPARNIKEFADYARSNKVSLGTYGAGSYSHCRRRSVESLLGIDDGSGSLSRRGPDVDRRRLGRRAGRQRQLRRCLERAANRQRPADRRAHQGRA